MSVSDSEFSAWLLGSYGTPTVLVELDHLVEQSGQVATSTLYFADRAGYEGSGGIRYSDAIVKLPSLSRELSISTLAGRYSASYGDLELANADGALDDLVRYAADGSEVRVYLGDFSWPAADFRLVFRAMVSKITATLSSINIALTDALSLLNKNIAADAVISTTGPNANKLRPINYGHVFNGEMLVANSFTLLYCYGNSTTEAKLLTVRDNGADVNFVDNHDGTLTLSAAPFGLITGDVIHNAVENEPESHRVSNFYYSIGYQWSDLASRGLFYGAHQSFAASADFLIGLRIDDGRNMLDLLDLVSETSQTFYGSRRDCSFTFGQIFPSNPPGAPVIALTADDVIGDVHVEQLEPTYYQMQALGAKNWKPQDSLASSLVPDLVARYSGTGLTYSEAAPSGTTYAENPALYHRSMTKSPLIETLISDLTKDSDWVYKQLAAYCLMYRQRMLPWVRVVTLTVGLRAYSVELGDPVQLTLQASPTDAPRFGLSELPLQVISVTIDLDRREVTFKLVYHVDAQTGASASGFLLRNLSGTPVGYVTQQTGARISIIG